MASSKIPSKMREIQVKTLGTDFRKVTQIVEVNMPTPGPKELLIRNRYVGVNAVDVNVIAGRMDPDKKPPFSCGIEGMGEVVQAGSQCHLEEGEIVVYLKDGAYAEYVVVPAAEVVPVPLADPALVALFVCGMTAYMSLKKQGNLKAGQTVLVTAAAGGTGHFAIQLAKAAGCHVIGTCSSDAKVEFLKSIGCDRPINYKAENVDTVLSKEYPKGMDLVFESVGNELFNTAFKHLAFNGHMIIIGVISGYVNDGAVANKTTANIPWELIMKNASMSGFFVLKHFQEFPECMNSLTQMYAAGKIKAKVDKGSGKPLNGLEAVADGIEHMYSGKNMGKVVVTLYED